MHLSKMHSILLVIVRSHKSSNNIIRIPFASPVCVPDCKPTSFGPCLFFHFFLKAVPEEYRTSRGVFLA